MSAALMEMTTLAGHDAIFDEMDGDLLGGWDEDLSDGPELTLPAAEPSADPSPSSGGGAPTLLKSPAQGAPRPARQLLSPASPTIVPSTRAHLPAVFACSDMGGSPSLSCCGKPVSWVPAPGCADARREIVNFAQRTPVCVGNADYVLMLDDAKNADLLVANKRSGNVHAVRDFQFDGPAVAAHNAAVRGLLSPELRKRRYKNGKEDAARDSTRTIRSTACSMGAFFSLCVSVEITARAFSHRGSCCVQLSPYARPARRILMRRCAFVPAFAPRACIVFLR